MTDESLAAAILKGLREAKAETLHLQEAGRERAEREAAQVRLVAAKFQRAYNTASGMVKVLESLQALPGSRVKFKIAEFWRATEATVKITTNIPAFTAQSGVPDPLEISATSDGYLSISRLKPETSITFKADNPDEAVTYVARRAALSGMIPMPG